MISLQKEYNFSDDTLLQSSLNAYVSKIIYNVYTGVLWDPQLINSWDRNDEGEKFAQFFINANPGIYDFSEENKDQYEEFVKYCAREIDRLLPRLYFMELNHELIEKYTPLLARRIYDIHGKDGFQTVSDIEYQFEHDFSEIENVIKKSMPTSKQVDYLKKLGKENGYLFWHEEYLSKNYASQMIEYLSEKGYQEPAIFSFFFVPK